ncbi:hypothetical protein LJY25_00030 [Hymenobacter sp. BT175]|uniref:hypothetical protein n=1 Tax=Hymenobacter translucens TaxID=2886507 RepID=UPI001D0DFDAD|nr:hypothetical protein [Hymenobacter translucens]MCC2544816.1 hypothetical protein [Hymenobacter translucens]
MQPHDIDQLFRDKLQDHAPAPPAFLWEQLEAELAPEPARKRPVMWMYAAAAVIALLLVAGGAWLHPGAGLRTGQGELASTAKHPAAQPLKADQTREREASQLREAANPQNSDETQATAQLALASSVSKPATKREVAPSSQLASLASTAAPASGKKSAATQATSQPASSSALAATSAPTYPERGAEPVPANSFAAQPDAAVAPALPAGPIEVEIRRDPTPATTVASAEEPARRTRFGAVLKQAHNALRGEQVSLAEAGLPESLTVQARVGSRTLTKTIQL